MKNSMKTSELDGDAWELYRTLREMAVVFQFQDRVHICCHYVSVTQFRALGILIRFGSMTLKELTSKLYLDKSTVSRVIKSLEQKNLISRLETPKDARVFRLNVTKEGQRLHSRIELELVNGVKKLIEDLDPDVRHATISLMARFSKEATAIFPRIKKNYTKRGEC